MYAQILSEPFSRTASSIGIAMASLPSVWQFVFAIAFGLVIGSFLNVIAYRLPVMLERAWRIELSEAAGEPKKDDGLPPRYNLCVPRSACPHC
ncbi:MAG: leader peptidase (prepilin peptidase) / N-methyltransferase, partial [Paraburkholderia sp.]|nr:leader peptidase (prepilin peptidase) / N-methyltransferase [Paraburkholderia sp.]